MGWRVRTVFVLICVCQFWCAGELAAQGSDTAAGEFVARVYTNARGETMPYRLFVPAKYDKTKKYPLVLWLHGANGRGTDNLKPISGGNALGAGIWTRPENQEKYPAFVLAPQAPEAALWANRGGKEITQSLRLALEILDAVRAEFSIDAARLYATGQSMGGGGVWDLLQRRPELFAAAVPLCGPADVNTAPQIAHIPVWVFHGEADATVPVAASRRMVEALRAAGGQPRYTEYPGVGHMVWEKAFQEPELVSWVFAQKREVRKQGSTEVRK
ncbi:MAG: prolyl oligopeptidase family serine peptidase [Acidobacteria bacterium]|nr:prolyl oligopeptidase family serine peptidase [Acidobacteriota bacterium]MBI3661759.1 prolyl oligopeptidase family serine peptidase [Acidobacteriota bacterium]